MPTRTSLCPFCESAKAQYIAVEGLSGEVRVCRCNACNKEWNEGYGEPPRRDTAGFALCEKAGRVILFEQPQAKCRLPMPVANVFLSRWTASGGRMDERVNRSGEIVWQHWQQQHATAPGGECNLTVGYAIGG